MEFGEGSLEGVAVTPNRDQWRGRRVLVTGNTGFKGTWLSLWLHQLGATVRGYSLPAPTAPSLFALTRAADLVPTTEGDVRDLPKLSACMQDFRPEVVLHLAAQALVRESYADPVGTYSTNVLGTVHLLEAVRARPGVKACVVVTSDKCYANTAKREGYSETDPMGGDDPYSSSKGCAELVTAAYRHSFFPTEHHARHGVGLATARAGNVIGGGDWAANRLIPDCLAAFFAGKPMRVRRPTAVRPWQHVLDPLCGYLLLAERLLDGDCSFAEAWNFGPPADQAKPVSWVVQHLAALFGGPVRIEMTAPDDLHEAPYLALDDRKTRALLGRESTIDLEQALAATVAWHSSYEAGRDPRDVTIEQIDRFQRAGSVVYA